MQPDQRKLLLEAAENRAYLSIAVTDDGASVRWGVVPWERSTSAYNMRTPKLTISAEDLLDESVRELLRQCTINGCYLYARLPSFDFLAEFSQLEDLYLPAGELVADLSFVRPMTRLFMLYLGGAQLPDLDPLIDLWNANPYGAGKCLGLSSCDVADTSALARATFRFKELHIWPVPGDSADRWLSAEKPLLFRFHETKI